MSCSAQRESQLKSEGWTKQFMADEPRLGEASAEYRRLGFEVLLEDVDPSACQENPGCTSCFELPEVAARFKIIFTRKAQAKAADSDPT